MTPKQKALYWREWAEVREARPGAGNEFRHELHERALGAPKSSKDFTNEDFDKVLAAFRAVSDPSSVGAQLRQLNQPKRRLIWKIRHMAPEAYWRAIARDRFGTADLEDLSESQLTQLRNTLAARSNALRRAQKQPSAAKAEQELSEANAPF